MKSLLIILLISLSCQLHAQNDLQCRVIDFSHGEPVEEANVKIMPGSLSSITDSDGLCLFKNIENDNVFVTVTRIGYNSLTKEINVSKVFEKNSGTFIFKIEQSDILSGEVKIYSTKIENQIKYAILPVSLLTKKEFSFLPVISSSDIMKIKPGINQVRDGIWATDINIRGLSRDNIMLYINGSRVETANNQGARFSMIDENTIERIEIIKGGVSSIYGSGGTGGIVSIKTETGKFTSSQKLKGVLSGEYFSVNKLAGTGLSLMMSDDNYNANLYATYREATDTETPNGVIPNSSFRDYGISFYAGVKLWENNEINFEYQKYESPYAGIPGSYPLFPDNAVVTYIPADRDLFAINYKIKDISTAFKNLSARFFIQNIFRNVEVIPNSSVYIPATGTTPARRIDNILINPSGGHYTTGLLIQSDLQKGSSKLILGLDAWQRNLTTARERTQIINILDSTNNIVSSTTLVTGDIPIPESKYTSVGIYANDETSFNNDRIYMNIGGRIDGIFVSNDESVNPLYTITNGIVNNNPANQKILWEASESNDISWSFNGGMNYKLTDKLNLSGNFSSSFRSPSLEERYQYIDLGNIVRVGNPNLQPELGYFISAAVKYWSEDLNLSLELFSNFLSDLITEIPGVYESRPALIKSNIGDARIAGFESQIDYNFYNRFTLYGNIAFVNGENTGDNSALPQIPPLNGIIGLKFSTGKFFSINMNSVMFASQYRVTAGELETPGYTVFNLYSVLENLKVGNFDLAVTLGLENIFDKSYRDHLSTSRGSYISEPGRNLYVKSKIVF